MLRFDAFFKSYKNPLAGLHPSIHFQTSVLRQETLYVMYYHYDYIMYTSLYYIGTTYILLPEKSTFSALGTIVSL